jgi:hypothetical protein
MRLRVVEVIIGRLDGGQSGGEGLLRLVWRGKGGVVAGAVD